MLLIKVDTHLHCCTIDILKVYEKVHCNLECNDCSIAEIVKTAISSGFSVLVALKLIEVGGTLKNKRNIGKKSFVNFMLFLEQERS